MEISYGLDFVYRTVGKLYIEAEAYKQQIARLEAELAGQGQDGAPGPDVRESQQASPEPHQGAERPGPVLIPIPPAPDRLADRSKPDASA